MIMLHSPHDHACQLALPMFRKVAAEWETPGNVTFAIIDVEDTPEMVRKLNVDPTGGLPAYALTLQGVSSAVRYRGGWSHTSISAWLQKQVTLSPVIVRSLDELRTVAMGHEHGLAVVGFLTKKQSKRRLLESAARNAQVQAAVALGGDELATALGLAGAATDPCVLVVRLQAAGAPWPLLRGSAALAEQATIESFLRRRALPSAIRIGDTHRAFSMQVRNHPIGVQVLLVHRSGARGYDAPSELAIDAMHEVAPDFDGRALFITYDFFDNDPDQFTSHKVYESQLPAVIVFHDRGGFKEREWRLPGGGEAGIEAHEIATLVQRALDAIRDTAAISDNVGESYLPAPPDFERVRSAVVDAAGGMADDDDEDADEEDDLDDDEEEEDEFGSQRSLVEEVDEDQGDMEYELAG